MPLIAQYGSEDDRTGQKKLPAPIFACDGGSNGSFGRVNGAFVKNGSHAAVNRPCVTPACVGAVLERKDKNLAFPNRLTLKKFSHDQARFQPRFRAVNRKDGFLEIRNR